MAKLSRPASAANVAEVRFDCSSEMHEIKACMPKCEPIRVPFFGDKRRLAVLLNIDLGELPGESEVLYRYAHIANIACGGHAGDEDSMTRAVALCLQNQTLIGAHPAYPDREGFGRTVLSMTAPQLENSLRHQLQNLAAICAPSGAVLRFVKAHGALYHRANQDPETASALMNAVAQVCSADVGVIGAPGSELESQALQRGFAFYAEGFADRGRRATSSGSWELLPRGVDGAVLTNLCDVERLLAQIQQENAVSTVCLHGDNPAALDLVAYVRSQLDRFPMQLP